jgi:hypothetical protein
MHHPAKHVATRRLIRTDRMTRESDERILQGWFLQAQPSKLDGEMAEPR